MFWAAWSFAVNVAGPFFNVYMLEDLHLGYLRLSLYSQLLSTTATVLFVRDWGRLADALGGKPVMTVCGAGAASIPRSGFCRAGSPLMPAIVAAINFLGGTFWSGIEVTYLNLLLGFSPEQNRSMFIAAFTLFVALVGRALTAAGVREKLLALLPVGLQQEAEGLSQGVEVKVEPAADYSYKQEIFRRLSQAIRENGQLAMVYYTFSRDDVTKRTIDPYHLVFHDGFWYLAAYCHHREEVRLFRVDRIQSLTPTGEHFPATKDFDFEAYGRGLEHGTRSGVPFYDPHDRRRGSVGGGDAVSCFAAG